MATVPPPQIAPGQQPTPEQIAQMQAHIRSEAQRLGLTVEQYVERLKAEALRKHQEQQQAQQQAQHQQQQQQQQQQPVQPGPPKPEALALASFLKSQDLKPRTCTFNDQRKDLFKVKRAIRVIQSPAYEKARKKNPILPEVHDRASAENAFKLLPLSMLALRVSKIDPNEGHEGHSHGTKKRTKGLWNVRVEQHQEAADDMHYMWLYEGAQWKQKAYAIGALALVFTVVLFPLWPLFMRQGVWYLSMGFLGLLGLFFLMAIFRLILFCLTMFTHPPGLWLFPNLFEDVGFFDSFKPVWAWHETPAQIKAKRKAKKAAKAAKIAAANGTAPPTTADGNPAGSNPTVSKPVTTSTGSNPTVSKPVTTSSDSSNPVRQRNMHATVEEADED